MDELSTRRGMRLPRWAPGTASLVLVGLVLASRHASGQPAPTEYQIKAEFLERFTRFIEWPDDAFANEDAPFTIALVGGDPFGPYLHAVADRRIKGRRVVIERVESLEKLPDHHLVFIAREARPRLAAILERTAGRPVLTVGDAEDMARAGAHIAFLVAEGSVRFAVNMKTVRASGLTFSAQLLRLARTTTP